MSKGSVRYQYILEGHTPVPCDNIAKWGRWFGNMDNRRVAATVLPMGGWVSTVFLGIDHGIPLPSTPPILFETMVFKSQESLDELDCARCATWDQAIEQHKRMVEKWKSVGILPRVKGG